MYNPIISEKQIIEYSCIENYIYGCEVAGGYSVASTSSGGRVMHLFTLILEGNISFVINGIKGNLGKNTFINVPIWSLVAEISYSSDFKGLFLSVSNDMLIDIFLNRNPFPPKTRFRTHAGFNQILLNENEAALIESDMRRVIRTLGDKGHHCLAELAYAHFYITLIDMADIFWKREGRDNTEHNVDLTRAEEICRQFAELVKKNINERYDIDFYADALCISKPYLSLVIKRKYNIPVGALISNIRFEIASVMLRNPDLNIQQIAGMLSFSDQSSFGKFFRKHAGMSPNSYRKNLKKTLMTGKME